MADSTPIWDLPYPELDDGADIETAVKPLALRLETLLSQLGGTQIGWLLGYAGTADPTPVGDELWVLADGRLIDKTTYGGFYSVQGSGGHVYNGGVDPGGNAVRIPDLRGRAMVGQDNMGTARGAASRIAGLARGAGGGVKEVTLAGLESGQNPNATHVQAGGIAILRDDSAVGYPTFGTAIGGGFTNVYRTSPALASRAADVAHTNLQPHEAENMIVRIK